MTPKQLTRLSKTVAVALRHKPGQFGLTLDPEGWVTVPELLAGLSRHSSDWKFATEKNLHEMIAIADKKRYEISGGKIRAFYGHSGRSGVEKETVHPPDVLYHGTTPDALPHIRKKGLIPMSRQYVHYSTLISTASMVGGRRAAHPVILTIRAKEAFESGIAFFHGNEDTWLSEPLPSKFIDGL